MRFAPHFTLLVGDACLVMKSEEGCDSVMIVTGFDEVK